MSKKRSWKFWVSRSFLLLIIAIIGLAINIIWFKPYSIRIFYDKIFVELALSNPELVSQLSIPVLYDWTKDELSDISDEKLKADFENMKANYATLQSYDFEKQSKENQLNTKILSWFMGTQIEGEEFFYYDYPVNQLFGVQNNLPSFMESAHKLNDKSDVEAYIARLKQFDTKFDQVLEGLEIREKKGIIPPKFVIERVLEEMNGFVGKQMLEEKDPVEENILFSNFDKKVEDINELSKEEKDAFRDEVREIVRTEVFEAYGKLISFFEKQASVATTDHGVWKFPNGDKFYAYQLKQNTTLPLSPKEVHELGLSEVARIKEEMFEILRSEGYEDTTKTLGELIQGINQEERFLFPSGEKGRKQIIDGYNEILDHISANLDEAFDIRPKADLEVQRVPEFKEEGAPGAYYNGPALDGSRGGVFYANLRDVHETKKFGMKTLAYHEGIPGHHFQIAIQQELTGVPIFRTVIPFTAYAEGWALYTERLAWELGFYEGDPFGNLGRLQAEMFRAVRLVVDTGIHYKKWTREQAIQYMVENTGMPTSEVTTEIERYIVLPGQACAYKIGMIKILELREKAKTALGSKFNLKEFHNVVLKNGAVPLEVLEELVDDYIQKA